MVVVTETDKNKRIKLGIKPNTKIGLGELLRLAENQGKTLHGGYKEHGGLLKFTYSQKKAA